MAKSRSPIPVKWMRNAGAAAGAVALGAYVYGAARFRRTSRQLFELPDAPAPGTPEFDRLVEGITATTVRPGNRVTVLRNGRDTFPSMLEAIASARRTIDFSSYIYWPGNITEQFSEALIERARHGVEINVVFDGYGSAKLDHDHVQRLERAGINVTFFLPPRWYNLHKLNNRMHRRLLIVDGRVAFAGGVGIADVWTGDAEDPEHWRETHARIEGPAVRDVFAGFAENWTEATGTVLAGDHVPPLEPFEDGIDVQVTRSSPTTGGTSAAQLFYAAIVGAEKRIWLTTAYFTAGEMFMDALGEAAGRGVDVRLVVNGPNVDKEVVRKTGQRSYEPLLESGVRIFEYQPTMLHAKVLIADGWANLGSSNFDHRSFSLDSELMLSMKDPGIVGTLEGHFLDDLEVSKELTLEAWRSRPLIDRVVESVGEMVRQSF